MAAFRAGANGKDGIVAVAGTGSAIHGWNGAKEVFVNNQGWVGKGGAEWIGKMVTYAIAEAWDGRGEKTALTDMVFKKYKFKEISKLLKFVYQDFEIDLAKLAIICDDAATNGDKVAREILVQAGKEIALAVRVAAAKLLFFEKTPLVLVGGTYRSRWVADTAMNEIERYYPKRSDFVVVDDPAVGAVKLAIEGVRRRNGIWQKIYFFWRWRFLRRYLGGGFAGEGGRRKPKKSKRLPTLFLQTQLHAGYGGVYPFLAKREHQKNLPLVFERAIKGFNVSKIEFVGVTEGPGLDPCLWTGINFSQNLAKKCNLPLVGSNHLEAHFLANLLTLGIGEEKFKKDYLPAVCLVVSGGHTILFLRDRNRKIRIAGPDCG